MDKKREGIGRRAVVLGSAAAAAKLALEASSALAQRSRKREPEKKEEPKLPETEKPEKSEFPGKLDAQQLDEYAQFLKTQSEVFSKGSARDIVRLLSGIHTVWDPEQYKNPEDRKHVYGPFSAYLDANQSKKLPVIPFKNADTRIYWNLTRIGEREALSSARMEYIARHDPAVLRAMERGVDVVVRKMASFGEYDVVPTLPITGKSNADLHCTRATLMGLAYPHKTAQDREERETVFVSGILLAQGNAAEFSKRIGEAHAAKGSQDPEKEILKKIAGGAMVLVPALGHEGVSILARTDSAVGAPLVNAEGELVGILSDSVELSYMDKGEIVPVRVFLVQGPDTIREAQKMAQ